VLPIVGAARLLTGHRLVSLPGTRCTGPLADSRDHELALVERARLHAAASGASSLEIRSLAPSYDDPRAKVEPEAPTWMIELPDSEAKFLDQVRRRSRRLHRYLRALDRSPLRLRWSDREADLVRVYSLLLATLRRLAVPPRELAQYRRWLALLGSRGSASVLVAELNGELVGGLGVASYNDTLDLSFIATDRRHARLRPDYVLYREAIFSAIARGHHQLDFGGAAHGSSLAAFKERWTARPTPRYRHVWLLRPRGADTERLLRPAVQLAGAVPPFVRPLWERTPTPLTRLGGAVAYRWL
jgi:hypothetical protein